ncbi:FAD-dependent monooxygenase [Pseudonocardia sp. RS11V-5]|uniref:FAD-dependent monooxygenase n=1 Tax=Pseudonocardia terrae TaxID=2905831 RepID=UPI001E5049D9|nr:FAD-dependent monooxygenase [Pseudonocardia terrae]MCE3551023.1 FAD-dependent monooxygenase [Pseudonocardia terrae]
MKIVVIGGGPGALYFAISAKVRDAGHDITVIERDPPGATYGWGVVYWDDLLDALYGNDAESARELRGASVLWQQQEVRLRGETAFYPGFGYSVGRAALLEILGRRAANLGVRIRYEENVDDLSGFRDADLIVAADGAGSRFRQQDEHFGTKLTNGSNPYIWLGTDRVFAKFLFDFRETPAGWVWCHAYPSSSGTSTFIVECQERTWNALGFGAMCRDDSTSVLEEIFSDVLKGRPLISESRGQPARWLRFTEVFNERWYHDNVVLLGDAAHTTHFTIGSGTRLAILDGIALAHSIFERADSLPHALDLYERRQRKPMYQTQAVARSSMAWYEHVDLYTDRDEVAFAAAMAARQGPLPPWCHQLHLLEQLAPVRAAHRCYETGRRFYLARRRGEPVRYSSFPGPRPSGAPAGTRPGARPRTGDLPAPEARSVAV